MTIKSMHIFFLHSRYSLVSLGFMFVLYLANRNLLVMFNNDFCWVLKCNMVYSNQIIVDFYKNIKL